MSFPLFVSKPFTHAHHVKQCKLTGFGRAGLALLGVCGGGAVEMAGGLCCGSGGGMLPLSPPPAASFLPPPGEPVLRPSAPSLVGLRSMCKCWIMASRRFRSCFNCNKKTWTSSPRDQVFASQRNHTGMVQGEGLWAAAHCERLFLHLTQPVTRICGALYRIRRDVTRQPNRRTFNVLKLIPLQSIKAFHEETFIQAKLFFSMQLTTPIIY